MEEGWTFSLSLSLGPFCFPDDEEVFLTSKRSLEGSETTRDVLAHRPTVSLRVPLFLVFLILFSPHSFSPHSFSLFIAVSLSLHYKLVWIMSKQLHSPARTQNHPMAPTVHTTSAMNATARTPGFR